MIAIFRRVILPIIPCVIGIGAWVPSSARKTVARLDLRGLALATIALAAAVYAVIAAGGGAWPVVAMSIRAVPPERSGLASGVNNTARQVGTALGVAVFGAAAGSPSLTSHFVSATHVLGVAAALAWLLVIAMIIRSARRPSPPGPGRSTSAPDEPAAGSLRGVR